MVELGLLAGPEDAEGEKAHAVGHVLGRVGAESCQQRTFGVNGLGRGNVQVEDEQGHGNGEDAVTERGEALQIAALNAVVECGHGSGFQGSGFCLPSYDRPPAARFDPSKSDCLS